MSSFLSRNGGMRTGTTFSLEEEVLSELTPGDELSKILVGRSDHPNIDCHGFPAAHTVDFLFLQDAQKFCLKERGHFADLIE